MEPQDVKGAQSSALADEAQEADLRRLGECVRSRRQELGLTQSQLAKRTGWSQERISILENARYGLPSLPALARLARALEVSLSSLTEAAGFPAMSSGVEVQAATPETGAALLYTLERLLSIEETGLHDVLDKASDWLSQAMNAEKIDIFLFNAGSESLIAIGTSDTPMGRRQHEIGLERLPLANDGRTVEAFLQGETIVTGQAEEGGKEPPGITEGLGIRSMVLVPFRVDGQIRGVLSATSAEQDRFSEDEVRFFEIVARWITLLIHREELLSRDRP